VACLWWSKRTFLHKHFAGPSRIPRNSDRFQKQREVSTPSRGILLNRPLGIHRPISKKDTNPTAIMCYLEDVFHSVCGHWGSAQVYDKCPNIDRVGWERGCWSRQTTGSISINSSCDRCHFDPEKFATPGTCLSVSQNKSGKMQVVICRKSGTIRQYVSKSPSGFFEWRLHH
jgi:hypothetical protein